MNATLGYLITQSKQIYASGLQDDPKFDPPVSFDVGRMPDNLDSYRGFYDDIALGFSDEKMPLSAFIKMLEDAVGTTFSGFKGGEYRMWSETPVWASDYGTSSNLAVVAIVRDGDVVVIKTEILE